MSMVRSKKRFMIMVDTRSYSLLFEMENTSWHPTSALTGDQFDKPGMDDFLRWLIGWPSTSA